MTHVVSEESRAFLETVGAVMVEFRSALQRAGMSRPEASAVLLSPAGRDIVVRALELHDTVVCRPPRATTPAG